MGALDLAGYKLTFRDEFNAFSWNSNSDTSYTDNAANGIWNTRYWWGNGERNLPGNAEIQYYSDSSVGINPFSIENGALRITATPSTNLAGTGNLPYVSGLITSEGTFAQQYGYFEMRAKLPGGQGLWPQWWLLAQDHSWPPEIDPLEAFGSEPNRLHWAMHTGPNNDGQGDWVNVLDDLTNSFHTYGVKWTAETLTYYFDGQEIASVATPSDMHKPMYLVMNLAVGGPWAGNPFPYTAFPAHMDIDHVRVYSNDPSAVGAASQAVSAPDAVPQPTAAAAARSAAPVKERTPAQTLSDKAQTGTPGDDLLPAVYGDTTARSGGAGDDTYVASDARMPILEKPGEGTDAVVAWMNYTLPPNVENISVGAAYGLHIQGNERSNFVAGNAGDDFLNGRAGDDVLTGGGGSDTFFANAGNGYDTITDFQAGPQAVHDRLVLDGYGLKAFADVKAALKQVGADAVLTLDNGETVVFQGVSASLLVAENFAFTRASAGSAPSAPTAPHPPAPSAPAPVSLTAGSGPDTLVLKLSQDAYQGNAQYTVSVDAKQVGGTFTASSLRSSGVSDTLTLKGDWAAGTHRVEVKFLNDAWGGTAATDRNLYVDAATYNGQAVAGAAKALMAEGAAAFSFAEAASPPAPVERTGTDRADLFDVTAAGGVFTGKGGRDLYMIEEGDGAVTVTDFASRQDKLLFVDLDRADVSTAAVTGGRPGLLVHYGDAGGTVFLAGVTALAERDMIFS